MSLKNIKLEPQVDIMDDDELIRRARAAGLEPPPKPKDTTRPVLPPNLGELPGSELVNLYAEMTTYYNWVSSQVVMQRLRVAEAEKRVNEVEIKLMESITGSEAAKKRKARLDPRYEEAKALYENEKLYLRLLEDVMLKSLATDLKVVSRAITVRTSEDQTVSRSESVSSIRKKRGGGTPSALKKLEVKNG